jgi:hypothetical protein
MLVAIGRRIAGRNKHLLPRCALSGPNAWTLRV